MQHTKFVIFDISYFLIDAICIFVVSEHDIVDLQLLPRNRMSTFWSNQPSDISNKSFRINI